MKEGILKKLLILSWILFSCKVSFALGKSDVRCMATAIYYEAGNQSKIVQISVGEVILNRLKHNWKKSICDIIQQPHQFTFKRKNKTIDDKYYKMAQDILDEKYHLIPNNILYFNSKRSKKFHHHKFYERIGKINFFYQ